MPRFFLIVSLFVLSSAWTQNQKKSFEGFFRGTNLNIQCRSSSITPWKSCNCIDSVIVNGENYSNILHEGYQIDLANRTAIKLFDVGEIIIYYQVNNELRILNPNDFLPKEILPIKALELRQNGNISWQTQQNFPDLKLWCQIEVYKWDDWIKVDRNYNIREDDVFSANILPYLNDGENKVRVTVASIDRDRVPSAPVHLEMEMKKLKCKLKRKKRFIRFNYSTHYKLFNEQLQLVDENLGKEISLKDYPAGTYFLWFGAQKKEIQLQ